MKFQIVSQLLAELDQVVAENSSKPVFVIGATNRPDLIGNKSALRLKVYGQQKRSWLGPLGQGILCAGLHV